MDQHRATQAPCAWPQSVRFISCTISIISASNGCQDCPSVSCIEQKRHPISSFSLRSYPFTLLILIFASATIPNLNLFSITLNTNNRVASEQHISAFEAEQLLLNNNSEVQQKQHRCSLYENNSNKKYKHLQNKSNVN